MYNILSIKRASNKISAQRDLNAVLTFLKIKMKHELDMARLNQTISINSPLLTEAVSFVESVINNIDEIKKNIRLQKEELLKSKKTSEAKISPDENYSIEMASLRDIKKSGLNKRLTIEEKMLLKNAVTQFRNIYSAEVKSFKNGVISNIKKIR